MRAPESEQQSRLEIAEHLRQFSRFEDREDGRAEEQTYLPTRSGPIFTTLVEPLGVRRNVGFLICHSFAWEQLDLYPLELTFARQAAFAGFSSLHFQARGYADSGGEFGEATVTSHLRDGLAAVEHLRRLSGVETVVPVGARWGAAVAIMVAGRIDAPGVVLWNPALDPGAYLDDMLRAFSRSRIAIGGKPSTEPAVQSREQMESALASGETIDLFGYPLTLRCYEDAASTHPIEVLDRGPPRTLVLVVNPRTGREAEHLATRLRGLGSDVRVEYADGPGAAQFGLGVSNVSGRRMSISFPLSLDVARRTVRWAVEAWGSGSKAEPAGASPANGSDAARREPPADQDGSMDDTESPSSGPAPVDVPVYVRSRGESLGAVVTVPDDPLPSVGVVLMSGLARDRAHRNGLWVKAAQRLARDGMYVLRIDYPGVGNSSGPPQTFDSANAPTWAIEDACRFLVEETPVRRVLLAGSCFGARVVLAAASGIPEVAGVALVAAPVSSRRPVSTKKQIRVRTVKLLNRGKRSEKALRRKVSARAPERPVDPAFADALDRFLERGRVYFLYGDRDIVWGELRVALERLRPPSDRYEVELVPGAIHSFRSLTMQGLALEKLVAWCGRSALDVRA